MVKDFFTYIPKISLETAFYISRRDYSLECISERKAHPTVHPGDLADD